MPGQLIHTTIPSGSALSGIINVSGAREVGLWVPVMTSATNLFVQGAFDTASANLFRIQNAGGSGDLTLVAGEGRRAFTLTAAAMPFLFLRFESNISQTAVRSLAVVAKW
jgi:hypothetical protein